LRRGAYQTLIANGDLFGFARFDADSEGAEQLIVLVNRCARQIEVEIDIAALPSLGATVFRDLLTGLKYATDSDRLGLQVEAKGCLLLIKQAGL
jgi:hypothetical protein